MAAVAHTYGPSCLLHVDSNTFTRRASEAPTGAPPIKAQFFYCSTLPIDDPLAPVPPPSSGSSGKATKLPPQPFSIHDNAALEQAWLHLRTRKNKNRKDESGPEKRLEERPISGGSGPARRRTSRAGQATGQQESDGLSSQNAYQGEESQELTPVTGIVNKGSQKAIRPTQPDLKLSDDPKHIPFDETLPVRSDEIIRDEIESGLRKKRSRSPSRRKDGTEEEYDESPGPVGKRLSQSLQKAQESFLGSSPSERDTSGTPFLRIPSRLKHSKSRSRSRSTDKYQATSQVQSTDILQSKRSSPEPSSQASFRNSRSTHSRNDTVDPESGHEQTPSQAQDLEQHSEVRIPVGVSRLHVVEMPSLKMGPIYWDPVHDVSSVVRGTWFYKDTMWPVESDIANQLEEGYQYIKPWTPTYVDELNICQEIGAEAELKLVQRLWPFDQIPSESSRPTTSKSRKPAQEMTSEKSNSQRQDRSTNLAPNVTPSIRAAGALDGFDDPERLFSNCSVIYANARDAQILRPNQLPSVSRGRRPLANIRKGRPVGTPVVRGFEYKAWEKLHPPSRKIVISQKAHIAASNLHVGTARSQNSPPCEACQSPDERPRPSELILVIHGIGQKLSERVESFHFTHAINSFRRQVNVELEAESVQPWLRRELGSVMVLPINWRSKIQLDDGGPEIDPSRTNSDTTKNQYSLKDITADSIPAVRNLMSDVLLDIPLYLSQHKPKMIEAVTKEANRVYRLWCTNNPGFQQHGRVHILAHSLGSVMTLDILSKQPTRLPQELDFKTSPVRNDIFEFDTKDVFFLGSPAGLFLFINHVPLIPRRGRNKPGADGEDLSSGVAGEAGTYGCLAVDNLYNVMHHIDPIAYQLNACVDVNYAASLQKAFVPSAAVTWAEYLGLKKNKPLAPSTVLTGLESFPIRPGIQSLPSTVEMETHNFTQEELAEKRMYLLNDNGQIDFTLRSAGGPLEIQYLNMLGAHSSYWTMQDFVRFLVVEIGRKAGKGETVASVKATKKGRGRK